MNKTIIQEYSKALIIKTNNTRLKYLIHGFKLIVTEHNKLRTHNTKIRKENETRTHQVSQIRIWVPLRQLRIPSLQCITKSDQRLLTLEGFWSEASLLFRLFFSV